MTKQPDRPLHQALGKLPGAPPLNPQCQALDQMTDEELLRAARQGSVQAFETFCVRSLPRLRRYLRFQCGATGVPVDLAADFAQDTLTKALQWIRDQEKRPEPGPLRVSFSWLMRIGSNTVIDWIRKNHRSVNMCMEAQPAAPTTDRETKERCEEVLKYFNMLGPDYGEMLELVLLENLGIVEAGERLGLSKDAAYKRYERGIAQLRDFLHEHGEMTWGAGP